MIDRYAAHPENKKEKAGTTLIYLSTDQKNSKKSKKKKIVYL